jgi:hypothetical protein
VLAVSRQRIHGAPIKWESPARAGLNLLLGIPPPFGEEVLPARFVDELLNLGASVLVALSETSPDLQANNLEEGSACFGQAEQKHGNQS